MASHQFDNADRSGSVSGPPSGGDYALDRGFRGIAWFSAALILALVVYIVIEIGGKAMPAISEYGLGFLTSTSWNVQTGQFGILPQIWGTLYSSLLALLLGGVFGIAIAIFPDPGLPAQPAGGSFSHHHRAAGRDSLGRFRPVGHLRADPLLRPVANWLHANLGGVPFFGTSLSGPGLAPAALVLAIMILPTVASISVDALRQIPYKVKEAAYGMGTTRWEAILKVMLPTASSGILAALVLGFGRALGETMALAMLIGNSNQISLSLFAPANTLAALLASSFPEAGPVEIRALMYAALALLAITLIVNAVGLAVMKFATRKFEAER
jgi:phosphate transport system permease protein